MSGKVLLGLLGSVVIVGLVGYGIFYNKNYGVDGLTTTNKKCSFKFINPLRCEPEQFAKKREYQVLKMNSLTILMRKRKNRWRQVFLSISVISKAVQL